MWHKGLIAKLKALGINGSLLKWFSSYLQERRQRVIIPGCKSNWTNIQAGVPQGSILGPLLFLIYYMNDIVTDIRSNIRLFADDTSLYIIVEHADTAALTLNEDITRLTNWANRWLVTFNPSKTESLLISRKRLKPNHPPLEMLNEEITLVQNHKHLGVIISDDGKWDMQIHHIKQKAWNRINLLRKLKFTIDRKSLEKLYFSFIRPILEYASVVWGNCTIEESQELEKIQLEAARIVTGATKYVSADNLYKETGWTKLEIRRNYQKLTIFYKMVNNIAPPFLNSLLPPKIGEINPYNIRNAEDFFVPLSRTKLYSESFYHQL